MIWQVDEEHYWLEKLHILIKNKDLFKKELQNHVMDLRFRLIFLHLSFIWPFDASHFEVSVRDMIVSQTEVSSPSYKFCVKSFRRILETRPSLTCSSYSLVWVRFLWWASASVDYNVRIANWLPLREPWWEKIYMNIA